MIDLQLAESYTPAVVCFGRVATIYVSYVIGDMIHISAFSVFVFLATILFLDRCNRRERIFDTTVVASIVIASLVINHHRGHFESDMYDTGALVWNVVWLVCSQLMMIFDTPPLSTEFRQLGVTSVIFLLHSWAVHLSLDSLLQLAIRLFFFSVATVVWMYTVNIDKLRKDSVNNCNSCIVYFSPVLFLSPIICNFFIMVSSLVIAYKCHSRTVASTQTSYNELTAKESKDDVSVVVKPVAEVTHRIPDSENESVDTSVMEAFRMAKEAASNSNHMA